MIKKLYITVLLSILMLNLSVLAKESKNMTRQEIADKNLETLFNITTKNNNGPDKDFMDILQKYIFGEVFTVGDLDIKTRELLTVTSLTVMQTLPHNGILLLQE
jgi:4-carboxymuconolactone decarboxylase